jgi:hypothetical protein
MFEAGVILAIEGQNALHTVHAGDSGEAGIMDPYPTHAILRNEALPSGEDGRRIGKKREQFFLGCHLFRYGFMPPSEYIASRRPGGNVTERRYVLGRKTGPAQQNIGIDQNTGIRTPESVRALIQPRSALMLSRPMASSEWGVLGNRLPDSIHAAARSVGFMRD